MAKTTSWQPVHQWYARHQKEEGGFYHKELLIPKLLEILNLNESSSLLDIGCGEGIFSRKIPSKCAYLGIDSSKGLIDRALREKVSKSHRFIYQDATLRPFPKGPFTDALFLLSLQNMMKPENALKHAFEALSSKGTLTLVLNHPCFRIPKASSWEFDSKSLTQYRRIDRYLSSFRSMIQAHPSKQEKSPETPSFHYSLEQLMSMLKEAGFCITNLLELCSPKKSYGKRGKAENFARKEFPLFMIIQAKKHEVLL